MIADGITVQMWAYVESTSSDFHIGVLMHSHVCMHVLCARACELAFAHYLN